MLEFKHAHTSWKGADGGKTLSGPWRLGKNCKNSVYEGPAPLFGHGVHQYVWQLFALDGEMDGWKLDSTPKRRQLASELDEKVWAWGQWV